MNERGQENDSVMVRMRSKIGNVLSMFYNRTLTQRHGLFGSGVYAHKCSQYRDTMQSISQLSCCSLASRLIVALHMHIFCMRHFAQPATYPKCQINAMRNDAICDAIRSDCIRRDRMKFIPNQIYKHIFHIQCGVTDMKERVSAYSAIYVCIRHYFGILVHESKFCDAPSAIFE